jgi:hypothetical protein
MPDLGLARRRRRDLGQPAYVRAVGEEAAGAVDVVTPGAGRALLALLPPL